MKNANVSSTICAVMLMGVYSVLAQDTSYAPQGSHGI